MKKLIVWIVVLVVLATGGYFAYDKFGKVEVKPQITEGTITRGNIAETVPATGTLTAVRTIDIGTQVSGTVRKLYADFNDIVKKGQLLAELDPSLLQTQVDMQEANLQRADVDINSRIISMENDVKKLERARDLFAKQILTREALDTAELQVKIDQANIDSARASRTQTVASLKQAQQNVNYTRIYAPTDGVITVRMTDEGRTVNASNTTPNLYTMATDLTKLLLTASIDEAEVSKVREGQTVSFRVDAHAGATFFGTVNQVRLNAKNTQNVVTYETVIDVNNPDYRLKPGMTATLNVEVHRADNVLRVPAAALRFRPTAEMFELIKQPVPPEAQPNAGRGAGGAGGRRGDAGGAPGAAAPGATPSTTPATKAPDAKAPAATPNATGGGNRQRGGDQATAGTGGRGGNTGGDAQGGRGGGRGGGRNMNLTPEQTKQMEAIRNNPNLTQDQRRAEMTKIFGAGGGFGGGRGGQAGGGQTGRTGGSRTGGQAPAAPDQGMAASGKSTIDQLLPAVQRRDLRNQRVWLWVNGQLKAVSGLTTGVSDGQFTQLVDGELKEGDKVVTNFVIPGAKPATGQQQQGNPFQQNQPGRGGPGGGGGGRGGF